MFGELTLAVARDPVDGCFDLAEDRAADRGEQFAVFLEPTALSRAPMIDAVDQDCPSIETSVFDLCGICIVPAAMGMFAGLLGLKGLRGRPGLPGRRGK